MQHSPAFTRLRRLRSVASLVVLGLLCRALIPAGFMPAAIGAGGPVALCHGGLAGEFFVRIEAAQRRAEATAAAAATGVHEGHAAHAGEGSHGGHADHSTHDRPALSGARDGNSPAADHEGWEHCPFGAAFGVALLAADAAIELPNLAETLAVVEPALPATDRPASSYRARAPPSSAIHS